MVLVSLSLLLFAIALVISPGWRRNAVRAYGVGFIIAGGLALAAVSVLGDTVVDSLARTEASQPAIEVTWTVATTLLHEIAVSTIGYGVLMLLGAILAGPTGAATAIRRVLAPYLREPAFAYGGLALLLLIGIVWWAPTPATRNPVTAILLAILIAIGFEGLRRRTAKEFPDADRSEAQRRGRERLAAATVSLRQWAGGAGAKVRRAEPVPAGPANGGVAAAHDDRLEQLERLGRLHDSGTIDDDEFKAEKQRILSAATP